jgi:hypothetical protein
MAREKGWSLTGPDGLLKQLTNTVLETALNEEMTEHLGYEKYDPAGRESGNIRNGTRAKTVLTESTGHVDIEVPRTGPAPCEPQIVKERQRRLTGVDGIVLSLYAKALPAGECRPTWRTRSTTAGRFHCPKHRRQHLRWCQQPGAAELGLHTVHHYQHTVEPGDESALLTELRAAGVDDDDLEHFSRALQLDRDNNEGAQPDDIWRHVRSWLGTGIFKAADVSGKVATSAAGGVVAGLIQQYFRIAWSAQHLCTIPESQANDGLPAMSRNRVRMFGRSSYGHEL